jgi:anion-transporting  ArsA/GET3 family ATPase
VNEPGGPSIVPPAREGLGPLLERARIAVVVGAGGTGKTTVAAAMAVRAARTGRKVVCLTIDPARRLADSLGVGTLDAAGGLRDITAALGPPLGPGGRLEFGMLDPVETFRAFVRARASSPERAERILGGRLTRYLSGSLSGLQEYMALEKLCEIHRGEEVELIVLDTPPTANAIDFFTAPRRMVAALDGALVRWMRRAYAGPGRVGLDLAGRLAGRALETIGRITGAELLGEIVGFVDALSDLFGSFAERAAELERVLAGDGVVFCLVTTPDRSTLREARELRLRLAGMGLTVHGVVWNRLHRPRVPSPPAGADPALVAALEPLGREWNAEHDRERELAERVRRAWDGLEAEAAVPLLPGGAARIEALDRIGDALWGDTAPDGPF